MEIKQQLRLSQQLVMTPQLQQAIRLLQMSRMELVETVHQELLENPVLEEFPQAPLIRESLEAAAPRPQTVYYSEVSGALQRVYHPASSVEPGETGPTAAELINAVLAGEELL